MNFMQLKWWNAYQPQEEMKLFKVKGAKILHRKRTSLYIFARFQYRPLEISMLEKMNFWHDISVDRTLK